MKLSRLFKANLGRAVIAAFAAQIVAGAMCLMPASAMEAVHASGGASTMPACVMQHGVHHVRHACPHCDAPVQAVSQIDMAHGLQQPAWVPVLVVLPTPPSFVEQTSAWTVPRILAPPGSAALIFRTSQRILI